MSILMNLNVLFFFSHDSNLGLLRPCTMEVFSKLFAIYPRGELRRNTMISSAPPKKFLTCSKKRTSATVQKENRTKKEYTTRTHKATFVHNSSKRCSMLS